jgi:hypothetical protein
MKNTLRWTALLLLPVLLGGCRSSAPPTLRGVWSADDYRLADGSSHPLHGRIFFGEREWTVLFFLLDERGEPLRGSGEGGWYTFDGEAVTFAHLRILEEAVAVGSLGESHRVEVLLDPEGSIGEPEACRVELVGDRLAVYFPSGNRIRFTRIEAP